MNEQQYETAIIDGDSIAWIIGYRHREEFIEGLVIADVDTFVLSILKAVGATYSVGFLGNDTKTSFRRDLVPSYKSNRGETPDWYKKWSELINTHLISRWSFTRAHDGYEADDMVAAAAGCFTNFIICGVDKDLKQIPGNHYNYSKAEFIQITEREGKCRLALQVLTGDSTDGIRGLPKVGPKTAEKMLEGIPEDVSLLVPCLSAYINHFGEPQGTKEFYNVYMQVKLHADINGYEATRYAIELEFSVITAPPKEVLPETPVPPLEDGPEYNIHNIFKIAS